MQLECVETQNFRNIGGKIDCSDGLNIFVGENGHGKTNWLEAIYLLSTARSFKTSKLTETISFNEEWAIVRGRVRQSEGIDRELQVAIQNSVKALSINGKKSSVGEYLGQVHAVVFNSEELEVVRGTPEARRRFIDGGIVSLHPPFVQTFSDYSRVLRHKTALLQTARDNEYSIEQTIELLKPWNDQLISLATRIHKGRIRFVERMNEFLHRRLFGREELFIRFVSNLEGKGDLSNYEALLEERLMLRTQAEMVAGRALVGPHRDDLEISFDGRDIRKYGSAGQQRSALLLLLLANIELFNSTRGEYPVFLLDDIDAELDHRRIGQLLEFLAGKTQTFVSTSKTSFVEEFGSSANVLEVENGSIAKHMKAAI
ncbi:MAG TPA: DNA replication and repair protein RecF [Pyrinomonadaceae bacterium]|nr:DNA replication and repair protein RecF [Chloracidobacterium sp.]HRJ87885.1 DNA replication and repair protein RecF [Pyrinomonadaceae bacterium]HRK50028.1 DNA replication and repair protein RecF [Pyrinomonadaceae bacterium]